MYNAFQFASAILKSKWLVDPQFALSQGSIIASILKKATLTEDKEPDRLSAFAIDSKDVIHGTRYSYYNGFDKAPPNSIAVISLKGALMKGDQYCGRSGMATIGNIVKEADNHHNIDGIVLHIDSPGGTVDGTEVLANIIKASEKPIVSFVDGLMASAALWIGSSADEIIASTSTDEIGSVGVLMSFMDIQPYYENKGVKFHTITASTSPEKVKMWEELRKGNYENYVKDILDPLDEKFMATIKENRPNVSEEHLKGKTFFAKDVMNVFVDSIGSLEDAILRASELAAQSSGSNSNSNSNINSMKQFTKLNAAIGVESLESVDENVNLNADQLQLVETALEEVDTVNATLQTAEKANTNLQTANDAATAALATALATAETAATAAETALAASNSAYDEIDETIAKAESSEEKVAAVRALLAKKPGAKSEGIHGDEDDAADANANWEEIDALEHNKDID